MKCESGVASVDASGKGGSCAAYYHSWPGIGRGWGVRSWVMKKAPVDGGDCRVA